MSIMARGYKGGTQFAVAPEGNHKGVLTDVWDIGYQRVEYDEQENIVPKVILSFEIDEIMPDGDLAGKRFRLVKRYTNSLHAKSSLRKDLQSWFGRILTEDEVSSGINLEGLIGKNCLLNVVHKVDGDKTHVNIASVSVVPKAMIEPVLMPESGRTLPDWVLALTAQQIPESEALLLRSKKNANKHDSDIPF